jgi:hypothetical protein
MKKVSILGIAILLVVSLLIWGPGPVMAHDEEFQWIDKPLSPVEGDDVYSIPPGSTIYHLENGITKVYGPDGRHVLTTKDTLQSLIPVPSGGLAGASHVHTVPSDSKVSRVGGEVKVYYDETCILTIVNENRDSAKTPPLSHSEWPDNNQPPPPDVPEGTWLAYSVDVDVDDLMYFYAYWSVPDSPPDPDYWAYAFIFNAIESPDYSDIIQPVLEWNVYTAGTYEWTCAAWYGIDGDFIDGTRIDASEGDDIFGYMVKFGDLWMIKILNQDTNESSTLWTDEFATGDNLKIFCALEGGYIEDDDEVPGDVLFYDMLFKDDHWNTINISWLTFTPGEAWGLTLDVEVYSDDEVEIQTAN